MLKETYVCTTRNDGVYGISYGNTRVQSSNISKITENTAIVNIDREKEIIEEINECKRKIDIINNAVEHLDPLAKQVVKLRFIESMGWDFVSDEVMYSRRQCQNKANDGIEELAIVFYGDKALEQLRALNIS